MKSTIAEKQYIQNPEKTCQIFEIPPYVIVNLFKFHYLEILGHRWYEITYKGSKIELEITWCKFKKGKKNRSNRSKMF